MLYGCRQKQQKSPDVPKKIRSLKHLTVYNPTTEPPDTVILTQKTVFKSNKHVFMNGFIGAMAVDRHNRVYIAASKPGAAGIYVFKPGGSYITTMGKYGRGPGEFESISSLTISAGKLYALDPKQQKIVLFTLKNFTHIKDERIKKKI